MNVTTSMIIQTYWPILASFGACTVATVTWIVATAVNKTKLEARLTDLEKEVGDMKKSNGTLYEIRDQVKEMNTKLGILVPGFKQ